MKIQIKISISNYYYPEIRLMPNSKKFIDSFPFAAPHEYNEFFNYKLFNFSYRLISIIDGTWPTRPKKNPA